MKVLKISAVFFFLIFWVGNAFAYDQFAGIDDGKLCLSVRAVGQKTTTQMTPIENVTNFYSAKVTVKSESYVTAGATGVAALSGYFFNAGDGQNAAGDAWLDIRIIMDENKDLKAAASITVCMDKNCSSEQEVFSEIFPTQIDFGTEYLLSIEVTASAITFKCNNDSLSIPIDETYYPSYQKDSRIMSRIYAGEGQGGYFSATFDDVCINNKVNPYDDFNNELMLDASRWDVELNVDWWYIQHRKTEAGTAFNRLCFGLYYNDGINITGDVVNNVDLYVSEVNPISLGEIIFWTDGENSFSGGYDCNSSQWYYGDWGEDNSYYYNVTFDGSLQPETYSMCVTLKDGQSLTLEKDFEGLKELPVISSDSFYVREDGEGNIIWTWDVPDGISQEWETSVRAFVSMYDSTEWKGALTIKVSAHMGHVFIPVDVVHKFEGRVDELGCDAVKFQVQLRTNDNCNRTYSKEITLEEASDPPVDCDVNGDGKIGLAEAIHTLQVVSGSR